MKRYKQEMPEEHSLSLLKTSGAAGAHVCGLCNAVSISKGTAAVCSKPSSATEFQDVTWCQPNGPEPVTEDTTWL